MIDFRYHLISLIAVFLALGLGILMGSVVLDEKLVERLNRRVDSLETQLNNRREEVATLTQRVGLLQAFSLEVGPALTADSLSGRRVVALEVEGTYGGLLDGLRDGVEEGGGSVASTIRLTDRFALEDEAERDELALILRSTSSDPEELRNEAAVELADRAAAAAAISDVGGRRSSAPLSRLAELLDDLQRADFVAIDGSGNEVVPRGALFAVLGGASDEPEFDPADMYLTMSIALADNGATVLVAEPSISTWDLVRTMRADAEASTEVATVDHADTVPGRIAMVLGLERAQSGITDHYGSDTGADSVIPAIVESP